MDKYTKGPVLWTGVEWQACIVENNCVEQTAAVDVYGNSEKKAKRLRKKIMKALNKVNDKEDKERLAILKNGLTAFFGEIR